MFCDIYVQSAAQNDIITFHDLFIFILFIQSINYIHQDNKVNLINRRVTVINTVL